MNNPLKGRRGIVTVTVLALLAGAGWLGWRQFGAAATPAESYIFSPVQRADIEDLVSATGALQPRDYVDVGAQVSGQLKKIHVEVGSEVKEGDLLAEIDAEQSTARVEASRAQLRSQQAQLVESQVALAQAERDLQRQKNLMAEDASTTEQLETAETALRTVRAQIDSLKAQMDQLRASTRVDESNLRFTRIYAPMSGTVVSITARQGQTLNTNQSAPTILRVADLSTMTVQTQVSEADVSKLRKDMPAYFTTLGSQGRRWTGQLRKVEPTPTVTNNVVLYNALFDVPNPNRGLMTQMTAQVFFVVAQARDVLVVPMAALTLQRAPAGTRPDAGASAASAPMPPASAASRPRGERGGGQRGPRQASVKVQVADGSVQEREITVGISNRVQAQVLSGLTEGERVVAGIKQPDLPKREAAQALGASPFGAPGMPPGAAAGGQRR